MESNDLTDFVIPQDSHLVEIEENSQDESTLEVLDQLSDEEKATIEAYIIKLISDEREIAVEEFKKAHFCIQINDETRDYIEESIADRIESDLYPETTRQECLINMVMANSL